jgi:serine protease Do
MVVDADGLVLTKASEIKPGKLTCWLANGKEVEANVLASDKEDDVALVRVKAEGLKPIQWATNRILEGQWAITPGLADTPQAVGIISTLTHRIDSQRRALMGIQWNTNSPDDSPLIVDTLAPGFGAEKAGIQPGDLIVAVDGAPVTNRAEVVEILKGFHDGQLVRVRYKRADKEFDVRVELTTPRPGQMGYEEFLAFRLSRLSGDVSERSEGFNQAIEHDTVLEPWQCGGPLVNLDGKVIGLNIARAKRVATYALPAPLVRQILAKLKSKALNPQTDN